MSRLRAGLLFAMIWMAMSGLDAFAAEVTPLITYQGRVSALSSGAVLNGEVLFTFRIYDAELGGTQLWLEGKTLTVADGLFSTQLGDKNALDPELFDGRDLWLGVKVGTDTEARPRQRLTPVPYALFAAQIPDMLSGSSADPILTIHNLGVGEALYGSTQGEGSGNYALRGTAGSSGLGLSSHNGVSGDSETGIGVAGTSTQDYGTYGYSSQSWGVRGEGPTGGVYGLAYEAGGTAILGNNTFNAGEAHGVEGVSASPEGRGVSGQNSAVTGNAYGVYGSSDSVTGIGVYGVTTGTNASAAGVRSDSAYVGVWGNSTGRWGVYGRSEGSSNSYGIYGSAGSGTNNYAGYFVGNVNVSGTLSKGSGSFKIDHPLDPENKTLSHSFVESPDMMNVYNGNVALDEAGEAWVEMPAWFEALNRDFRYQLTALGQPAPGLYVAEEIAQNRFRIAGGPANGRVSWQVTGVRQDKFAQANPIIVEEMKPAEERGTYLHPQAWGASEDLGVNRLSAPSENKMPEKRQAGSAQEAQRSDLRNVRPEAVLP